MHRHHAKRVFLVKRTRLWEPQVDCQELQKPPREPQGYQRYRTSGRGAIANQMKKDKILIFIIYKFGIDSLNLVAGI